MSKTLRTMTAMAMIVAGMASMAMADGMIVPVRHDIRVRGHWAVNYHHVKMTVRDQVASVTIDQEFENTGSGMIEVEYLFPVPPGAAIDAMTLVVDGKEFSAKLLKADEARKIYEDIVRRKKDPALLEYAGFGLYRTRAFPLLPGKPVKVIVHYDYVCKKDRDLTEVWYPLNTEKFSSRPIRDVKVVADIKGPADITAVYSPTHDLSVERKGPRHVVATYQAKEVLPASDFQLFYKSADEAIGATLLTRHADANEDGYFMALVSPNPRTARQKRIDKDIVIVLDRSGSMSSNGKIDQAKAALRFILENMTEFDRFNVITYSDTVETFFDGLVKAGLNSPGRAAEARAMLDRIDARGGTNIHDALVEAMKCLQTNGKAGRAKYVIFLTDGLATIGKTDEGEILAGVKKANTIGARLFAFGVGYNVNVRLLDKLVGQNNGRSDYVRPNQNIEGKISSLYAKIKNPVMTGVEVGVRGLRLRDTYPRQIGDLFEGDQIVLVGRYRHADLREYKGVGVTSTQVTLTVTGTYGGEQRTFEYLVTVQRPGGSRRYEFIERLWATRRVGWLMDQIQLNGESKEIIDELIALSTKYGIMTPYTSFLAREDTDLADAVVVGRRMRSNVLALKRDVSGSAGQKAAMTRQKLNYAKMAPQASAPASLGVAMTGNTMLKAYEADEKEYVQGIRQVGNQAIYQRGKLWVVANASKIDPKKDAAKIQEVERFSDEYFLLARANSVADNQILASQQPGEELLIVLRGQAYRIR